MTRFILAPALAALTLGASPLMADSHAGVMDSADMTCASYNAMSEADRTMAYESLLVRPGETGAGTALADTGGASSVATSAGESSVRREEMARFEEACAADPEAMTADVLQTVIGN